MATATTLAFEGKNFTPRPSQAFKLPITQPKLGEEVKRLRTNVCHISRIELAKQADVTHGQLCEIEAGGKPYPRIVKRITDALQRIILNAD